MENDELTDKSVDEIIASLRAASAALAALNEQMARVVVAIRDLNAGTAQRLAAAACYRAGQQSPKPSAAEPPESF
jgi:hypothetical protein